MDRIVSVWDKCSKIAADYGLNVCWEFEPGFVFNKPSEIVQDRGRGAGEGEHQLRRAVRHLPRPHVRRRRRQPARATKETLPGGELELLEKLKGKITHVHLIDSDGSLNEHNTSHAQPVRHRQAELRQAGPGAAGERACRTTGGASTCASGRTPGT